MIFCDFRGFGKGVFGTDTAVRPYFHNKLIVIVALTDAAGLDCVLYLRYGRKNRVHRNRSDNFDIAFVFFGGNVAASQIDLNFEFEAGIIHHCKNVHALRHHLKLGSAFEHIAGNLSRSFKFE